MSTSEDLHPDVPFCSRSRAACILGVTLGHSQPSSEKTTMATMARGRLLQRGSHSRPSLANKSMIMSILGLLCLLPIVLSDNRSSAFIELQLDSPTYDISQSINMQSSGFIDVSFVNFTSVDFDSIIDIAVFVEPEDGSSYHTIGLGNLDGEMCCSSKAQKSGDCTTVGRLNVKESFVGVQMSVFVPAMSDATINPSYFDPTVFVEKEGSYSLLFANCNENATKVQIIGVVNWDSFVTHEEIEHSVPFYVALTVAYLVLMTWFGYLMYENRSTRIRLEEYIFAAIVLGVMETLLTTIDYANDTKDLRWLTISASFFGTLKHGLARCILMMVSLGWGVTVPSLQLRTMVMILVLGASYAALTFTLDMAQMARGAGVEEANSDDDALIQSGPVRWVALFLSIINFVIWIWVLFCLNVTIKHLEDNQQERKLRRYKWLLNIMITAVIMNIAALIFISTQISDGLNVNITIWPATMELGFFLVVACIACLWQPNPNAREFAYVEEVNMENDSYELELTEDSNNVLHDGRKSDGNQQISHMDDDTQFHDEPTPSH